MTDPIPTRRSFHPTPGWLIFGLLVVEGLLWLSERLSWFPFNHHKGWTVLICVAVVGGAMLVMLGGFVVAWVFRWRFQFSIRSLLMLTVAVAIPCSWLAMQMKRAVVQRDAVVGITTCHGSTNYDWQGCSHDLFSPWSPQGPSQPPPTSWLRDLLGDDFFDNVTTAEYSEIENEEELEAAEREKARFFDYLSQLVSIEAIKFAQNRITDTDLAKIRGLTRVRTLYLLTFRTFV